ncbi:MAG: SURF1 family protein [Actinomycetota bacterium]
MSQSRSLLKKAGNSLLALILISAFIWLGFWQLDRAGEVKELQKPYQEQPIVPLSEVAKPNSNLSGESVNRIVEFSGVYVAQFDAPNQVDSTGRKSDWLVALMEVDGGGYLLVLRSGVQSDLPRGDIKVTGRIFPRQYEDISEREAGKLSRLDPSLLVAQYPGDYYDGFVAANNEIRDGMELSVPRVILEPAAPSIPGYYWQHIAYVVIWWLMALVVLFLPLYGRWRERNP